MSAESGEFGLLTRVARLEGQVDLLTRLLAPRAQSVAATATPDPLLPEKIRKAITDTAFGNRALERHLTKVALELKASDLDEDVIAKRIRDGDRVD